MYTGWLCYGGLLEKFEERKSKVLDHIQGIVSDSCPEPKVGYDWPGGSGGSGSVLLPSRQLVVVVQIS